MMMKTINNLLETILGFVVISIAVVFVGYVYKMNNGQNLNETYSLVAKFDRIDGLSIGSDVKLSGVKIGIVRSIEIDAVGYQAKAILQISKNIKLPTDSSAEIVSESLLGGKYIALVPGGDETDLEDFGTIGTTYSSVSFENLLSKYLSGSGESVAKPQPKKQPTPSAPKNVEKPKAEHKVSSVAKEEKKETPPTAETPAANQADKKDEAATNSEQTNQPDNQELVAFDAKKTAKMQDKGLKQEKADASQPVDNETPADTADKNSEVSDNKKDKKSDKNKNAKMDKASDKLADSNDTNVDPLDEFAAFEEHLTADSQDAQQADAPKPDKKKSKQKKKTSTTDEASPLADDPGGADDAPFFQEITQDDLQLADGESKKKSGLAKKDPKTLDKQKVAPKKNSAKKNQKEDELPAVGLNDLNDSKQKTKMKQDIRRKEILKNNSQDAVYKRARRGNRTNKEDTEDVQATASTDIDISSILKNANSTQTDLTHSLDNPNSSIEGYNRQSTSGSHYLAQMSQPSNTNGLGNLVSDVGSGGSNARGGGRSAEGSAFANGTGEGYNEGGAGGGGSYANEAGEGRGSGAPSANSNTAGSSNGDNENNSSSTSSPVASASGNNSAGGNTTAQSKNSSASKSAAQQNTNSNKPQAKAEKKAPPPPEPTLAELALNGGAPPAKASKKAGLPSEY